MMSQDSVHAAAHVRQVARSVGRPGTGGRLDAAAALLHWAAVAWSDPVRGEMSEGGRACLATVWALPTQYGREITEALWSRFGPQDLESARAHSDLIQDAVRGAPGRLDHHIYGSGAVGPDPSRRQFDLGQLATEIELRGLQASHAPRLHRMALELIHEGTTGVRGPQTALTKALSLMDHPLAKVLMPEVAVTKALLGSSKELGLEIRGLSL